MFALNRRKTLLFLFNIVILFLALFYLNNYLGAQSGGGLKLSVYPNARFNSLGSLVQVGINRQPNLYDDFYKFYAIPPTTTVLDKSFYRLEIPATTGINLRFERKEPNPTSTSLSNNCEGLNGRVEGNNCIIEGMFNRNVTSTYELWQISASSSNSDFGSIYFYLVSSTTALNPASRDDQYYLIPTSTMVILDNNNQSATTTYSIYYKKLYCPTNLSNADSVITSNPSGFVHFSFSNTDFYDQTRDINRIFITRNLGINSNAASGTYNLFLVKSGGGDQLIKISYNTATIYVTNNITPPSLSLNCNVNPTTVRINSSTVYTLTATSDQNIGYATFTLEIATSGGSPSTISWSSYYNSSTAIFSTSVTFTASGTYYATGTVNALGTSVRARCDAVNVEMCRCLFAGSVGDWRIRCQDNGRWGDWQRYGGNTIDENCNCNRQEVSNTYPQCRQ
mgnify:CR=1 FL=1|jgi:hypothetical protein